MKLHFLGRHANRIPLSYPVYRKASAHAFDIVASPEKADILVFGFSIDIKDHAATIFKAMAVNPRVRVVVLSEEPLWDTLWTANFQIRNQKIKVDNKELSVCFLNHFTTSIFEFESFPYFITTEDKYFARHQMMFRRNAAASEGQILAQWQKAPIFAAFYAEHRMGESYIFKELADDTYGLSEFRTRVASGVGHKNTVRVGHGWGQVVRRQALPDWHLDKLANLDRSCWLISGLENTHCTSYISEKIFDGYAAMGYPVYFASEKHLVRKILPEQSYINLYGLTAEQAVKRLMDLKPSKELAEIYRETQMILSRKFSGTAAYVDERHRVVNEIRAELERVASEN